jgi:hypothetical protein
VKKNMKLIEVQLSNILNSKQGERAVHKFLKDHNQLVVMAFNRAWNFYTCVPEFKLGDEFRSDFLILSSHSRNWHAIFIELKDFNTKLYNKDGSPTNLLRQAQRQINDWKEWVRINESYLRQRFASILKKEEAPAIWPHTIPNNKKGYISGSSEVADIKNCVDYYYHIVIGRSSTLTPEEREFRQKDSAWGGPEIATYDRLLTMARRVDKAI